MASKIRLHARLALFTKGLGPFFIMLKSPGLDLRLLHLTILSVINSSLTFCEFRMFWLTYIFGMKSFSWYFIVLGDMLWKQTVTHISMIMIAQELYEILIVLPQGNFFTHMCPYVCSDDETHFNVYLYSCSFSTEIQKREWVWHAVLKGQSEVSLSSLQ